MVAPPNYTSWGGGGGGGGGDLVYTREARDCLDAVVSKMFINLIFIYLLLLKCRSVA